MDELILRRLILAKTFLLGAKASLERSFDENSLALATVQLHDAADNLLGAVVTYKNGNARNDLRQTYDEVVGLGVALTHNDQIKALNTHRNNIKHQGIIPNSKDLAALLPAITNFCETTCKTVFSLKLSEVSRVELIDDKNAKSELNAIKSLIDSKNYKQAMTDCATVLFNRFINEHLAVWRLSSLTDVVVKSHTNYEATFPNGVANDLHVNLMEIGIDPYLYHRFGNLTPQVGRDMKTTKLVYKFDGHVWHEDNWTEENALFCYNFVIDSLISQQRKYSGYNIEYRDFKHKIKFKKDTFTPKYGKHELKNYKAGEIVECILIDYADGQFQPNKFSDDSENSLTEAIMETDGVSDIYLFKVADVEVIEETTTQKEVTY